MSFEMEKFLIATISLIIVSVLLWLFWSFCFLNFNVLQWPTFGRVIFGGMEFSGIVGVLFTVSNKVESMDSRLSDLDSRIISLHKSFSDHIKGGKKK